MPDMDLSDMVLSLQHLKTYFFTLEGIIKAVDDINLNIEKGKAVGLVGESGSGKSMTALSIIRLVPSPGKIVEGTILYKEKNLLKLSEQKMNSIRGGEISIVFQNPMTFLNPVMKIGDQIAEAIILHERLNKKEAKERTKEVLERVRIPSPDTTYNNYPHQLSGGMQQRVLIAIALSCNPSLLILDEPTTALDVTIQSQIIYLIKELKRELGTSMLLITHDLGIVADIADSVYVMYAGEIMEYADIFTLYEQPGHPYTTALLKSVPSVEEFKGNLVSIPGTTPNPLDPPPGCKFHPRCEYAMEICRQRRPPISNIGNNHFVSCWLFR